ncbi:RpiB/LacA/LacB family sugar-phosphate isomerase [Streptomyces sp. NPDC048361]|uniref:RpiB/LacA/LacB family sugar-phosphate isomerase n=1 Tax=Streptomyces sp. NPDC048361 TaxID=3154720 RepID=UPI0034355D33
MPGISLAIGGDELALELKDALKAYLAKDDRVGKIVDVGTDPDNPSSYVRVGIDVATLVQSGEVERAVVLCGSGTGVAMAAGKVPGVRAVLADNLLAAKAAVEIDNAPIIAMGGQVVGPGLAKQLLDVWLDARFDPDGEWAASSKELDAYEASRKEK